MISTGTSRIGPSVSIPVTDIAMIASSATSAEGTAGSPGPTLPRSSVTSGPSSR